MPVDTSAPFTTSQAIAAGLTPAMLRTSKVRRLFRGVYVSALEEPTFWTWLRAALLVLPPGTLISHVTALRLYGFELDSEWPLHVSTNSPTHTRIKGIRTHRRKGRLHPYELHGVAVTGPDRTLVDIATKVRLLELVQAIEWMLYMKLTTLDDLADYAFARHLDGVRRVRRLLAFVREGVESPMETTLRLMIVFARLPEPECNRDIRGADGRFIARGDLVYLQLKVLVEYDGWHHERDSRQRQRDLQRRELLEAAGWRVIVVTSQDMRDKQVVVRRVHRALTARGHTGPEPIFNIMWLKWFA